MNVLPPQHRRSTDSTTLAARVARMIGGVVRITNTGLRTLVGRRATQAKRTISPQSLMILREHLLGSSRETVCDLLGRPPMCEGPDGSIVPAADIFASSDTWYFPLDETTGTILVARFEENVVVDTQFVEAPAVR